MKPSVYGSQPLSDHQIYPYPSAALPSIITGFTIIVIFLINATSLAGYLDGSSLGVLTIRYGYQY
ncbi:hypothetical protein [Bartonella sp. 1-1C]|uniref:hypothetical protein n=1 Tax=Bartonella sp. 1-1C TaxID=515256 RepID=UPI0001F4BFCF|nr:hypothetical protein [Bartonella sp. 1-1C]CBI80645.1 hypothetical protein B11C_110256 [Bartonella sp. 1-1C]